MADSKRKANIQDEVSTSKRSKITHSGADSLERENKCVDFHNLETNKEVLAGSDNRNGRNSQQSIFPEGMMNSLPEVDSSSKDSNSCKSEVLCQKVSKLSSIEADAAEDKGSRHAMEDAWVVLPDASLEYPGKLRCAHFAIYDGHGGRLAAEYAKIHLHANVLSAGLPHGYKSCQEGHP